MFSHPGINGLRARDRVADDGKKREQRHHAGPGDQL